MADVQISIKVSCGTRQWLSYCETDRMKAKNKLSIKELSVVVNLRFLVPERLEQAHF